MAKIIGHYQVGNNSSLLKIGGGVHLIIGTRHQRTISKPGNYLLERVGKRHKYISSLYPVKSPPGGPPEAQEFTFDWQGRYYHLVVDQAHGMAEIEFSDRPGRGENSPNSYNIGELGSKTDPGGNPITHTKTGADAAI